MSLQNARSHRSAWLESFIHKHGRPPRVLHIGNIANNAYNNAKLLNNIGLDCDVICYDYYHVMGCPEWEDADFEGHIVDQFHPNWASVDLRGFQRPAWFAQGPLHLCAEYLIARRSNDAKKITACWARLATKNGTKRSTLAQFFAPKFYEYYSKSIRYLRVLTFHRDFGAPLSYKLQNIFPTNTLFGKLGFMGAALTALTIAFVSRLAIVPYTIARNLADFVRHAFFHQDTKGQKNGSSSFADTTARLIRIFESTFPDRKDKLTAQDFNAYGDIIKLWKKLFDQYDLVQAYATDPILPLIAGKRPVVAFEHGTLRAFTLADNAVCRLTSLAYNQADHVFITNGDCLDFAKQIGVKRYTPMLHPFDEERIRSAPQDSFGFREQFGVKYVFLCTLRHDWSIKGTDKYILALPMIAASIGSNFKLLMTRWGNDLDASMALAKNLKVDHLIEWIEPLNKYMLIRAQKSVDILFDQIALPHFGATAPEGIAAGVPVIMSYDPTSTNWIVSEPAPILSAWTADEIAANVKMALDSQWLSQYKIRAAEWIDKHHNSSIVVERHLDVYRQLIPV